jgi:hypothetical protein
VSGLEERLKESLPHLVAAITSDPDDLVAVRDRADVARRRAARRAGVAGVLAVVGVLVIVAAGLGRGRLRGDEPVAPPRSSTSTIAQVREVTDPFTVIRRVDAPAVGVDRPLKLAVSPGGHVYVTDQAQHVTELDASGEVVRQWGGAGTAPGKFRLYSGAIAVGPDGKVYVADTGNFRIQVFTSSGRFVAQYGGFGSGPGEFVWPSDIVVAQNGTMYVADDRAATITALSSTGQQLWRRGTPGDTNPHLIGHEHLGGVNAEGQLVTANDDTGEVLWISPAGRLVQAFSTNRAGADVDASGTPDGHFPNGACGATLDRRGDVYVNSCEESYQRQHDTAVYDPQHRLIAGWKRGDLADSPEFGAGGRAWAVTAGHHPALVELRVELPEK